MKNWAIILSTILMILMLVTSADNYGSANGQVLGGDDISNVTYPRMKLIQGIDGTNDGDISSANPLYVVDAAGATAIESTSGLSIARGEVTALESINVRGQTINADVADTDIWAGSVDTPVYVAPTVARVHNITSTDALDVLAAGTFTMADAGTEDEVLLIGAKTYTLRDTLTDVDGYVKREVAATDTVDNIIAAINLGAGSGTAYAASTTANAAPTSAIATAGDALTLYAETAIVTTSTVNSGFGAATAVLGTGAQTVIVYGLTSWSTTEVNETLNMTGITDAATTNSYVILNRFEVVTSGGTTINAGIIKATAATDSSVSAYISAGAGISHSAIMGVPSIETFYLDQLHFTILAAGTTDIVNFSLLVNTEPDSQLTQFKQEYAIGFVGADMRVIDFNGPLIFTGSCIIKLRALSDTADSHVGARFGGTLETN